MTGTMGSKKGEGDYRSKKKYESHLVSTFGKTPLRLEGKLDHTLQSSISQKISSRRTLSKRNAVMAGAVRSSVQKVVTKVNMYQGKRASVKRGHRNSGVGAHGSTASIGKLSTSIDPLLTDHQKTIMDKIGAIKEVLRAEAEQTNSLSLSPDAKVPTGGRRKSRKQSAQEFKERKRSSLFLQGKRESQIKIIS